MSNERDIAQLFAKKFENFELTPSEREWRSLSPKLSRVNFLKFSFATFNAYYLMAMIAFTGIAAYSGFKGAEISGTMNQLERTIQSSPEKKTIAPQPSDISPKVREHISPTILPCQKDSRKKEAAPNNLNIIPPCKKEPQNSANEAAIAPPNAEVEKMDTATLPKPEGPTAPPSPPTVRVKKIRKTLVIKPQVVVVKDSVVIKNH